MPHLSDDWQQWIQDNLTRGSGASVLVNAMARDDLRPTWIEGGEDVLTAETISQDEPTTPPQVALQAPVSALDAKRPRIRHQGPVIRTQEADVRVVFRMTQPVIVLLDHLLSNEECDELIRLSRLQLGHVLTIDKQTGREVAAQNQVPCRENAFLSVQEHNLLARLDYRISEVMDRPIEAEAGMQVLHYHALEDEDAPHDNHWLPSQVSKSLKAAESAQRVGMFVIYLNDIQTTDEKPLEQLDFSAFAKKGSALYFEYGKNQAAKDLTLQEVLPISAGDNWIATRCVRAISKA